MKTEKKIKPREELKEILEIHRKKGKTIGFTCGAFDLLHAGHLRYLEEARNRCDILVVAVNTDESVRGYKGEKRPINPEEERIRLVAGLEPVDYVTFLFERRPAELMALLKPHFYFKGGDYAVDELESKDILEDWGGRAEILPVVEGKSTSAIIDRVLQKHLTDKLPHKVPARPAIFLDRDGTINEEVPFLHKPEKFEFLPNVIEGLKRIQDLGYWLVIVTNQQGIGLGYFPEEDFFRVNSTMFRELSRHGIAISKIYFCPHSEADDCDCRKPKIGLVKRAEKDLNLNLERCYFIGDRPTDVETGRQAGCKTILLGSRKEMRAETTPTFYAEDLIEAAEIISRNEK